MIKTIAPVYIKREGALKAGYVYSLGSKKLIELKKETEDLLEYLNEEKENVISVLETEYAKFESCDEKKCIINIKRDIFNMRPALCKTIAKNKEFLEKHGLYDMVGSFANEFERYNDLKQSWRRIYLEEELSERKNLVNAYKNNKETLDKAAKFIHPTIPRKMKPYLETEVSKHNSKLRKCDDTVAKIITRAGHKTSPFSTLTNVGAGIIGDDITNLAVKGDIGENYFTVTKFNLAYAMRIFDKVMLLPEIVRNSSFRFADTLVLLRGVFYWTILIDEPTKRKKVYKSVDELIKVKANDSLILLYEKYKDEKEIPFKEMKDLLMSVCKMDDQNADSLLQTLVGKQFFVNTTYLDQNSDNVINEFINIISEYNKKINSSKLTDLLGHLETINNAVSRIDTESSNEQYLSLAEVSEHTNAITEEYSIAQFDEKQLLYQDSILKKVENIDKSEWQPVLKTLQTYQEFNEIFDVAYRFQLMLGKIFYEKFGNEKVYVKEKEHIILDVLLTNLIKHTNLWDDQLRVSLEDFDIPEIHKLEELKNRFLTKLISEKNNEEIDISLDELNSYIDEIPEAVKERTQSNSFFVQNTSNKKLKVLNDFYAGHQIFFARFLKNMPAVCNNEKFRSYISQTMENDNISDIFLMYGFNANIRKPLSKTAISLPNNRCINNEKQDFTEVVDWKDLYLQYSHKTKRIHLYNGSRELKVQFLGTLVTTLLPALPAMIHILNFNVVLLKDVGYSLIYDRMEKGSEFTVERFPRIVIGENVVISRKRWLVNTKCFNEIEDKKESDLIKYLLDISEKLGIPNRCFVSKFFYKNDGLNTSDDNTDKPMYMDLSSPVLTVILKKMLQNTKYMIFEELLPNMDKQQDEYVSEYIFESTFNKGE